MSASKTTSVGLRFPSWCNYGPSIISGVISHNRQNSLWDLSMSLPSHGELKNVNIGPDWEGDGLILFRASKEELAGYRKRGIAVVVVSSEGPADGYPRVHPNNVDAGLLAAEHLSECQLIDYAYLARGETIYQEKDFASGSRIYSRQRLAGFRERVESLGGTLHSHYLRGEPLWDESAWRRIQDDVNSFLTQLPSPCALFVADDSLAAVVVESCREIGKTIPDDLPLIGFGNDPIYCLTTSPPLTSIEYPGRKIGEVAAALLQEQMKGQDLSGHVIEIPVKEVKRRESTQMVFIEDLEIQRLVHWIRREAIKYPIRVAELEEYSSYSATTIKERFKQHLGHSPKREIDLTRLNAVKNFLTRQSLSITDICKQMQFTSPSELSRFFHRETGTRPSEYREQID